MGGIVTRVFSTIEEKGIRAKFLYTTTKGIKDFWIPDMGEQLLISDIFISGNCNQQNKILKGTIEFLKNGEWIIIGPIFGIDKQVVNFSHSFANPFSIDVGDGINAKIRVKILGDMSDNKFELTFNVLTYNKQD